LADNLTKINYWIIISGIAALFVLFFLGPFPLSICFALLFFLSSVVFANHIFAEDKVHIAFTVGGSRRFLGKLPYLVGAIATLFILLVPFTEIQIQNSSMVATFSSFSAVLLLKIVFGLFLLGAFPGHVLYRRFLNSSFSCFEKIGLILALSYCVNAVLGLLLSTLNLLSPISYLASIWLFVFVIEGSGKISKRNKVQTSFSTYSLSWESLLLLLTGVTLLLGSYSLVMACGPISGLFSGDPSWYMESTNGYFNLGISSYISWLSSYMVIGTIVTGLPLIYVYSAVQYLVLLVPFSIFFFMKTLFPQQKKAAGIGAFMVSLLYGMSSLPFLAKLMETPSLLTTYLDGAVQSTLRNIFASIFWANTQSYVLWNRTIEYGLGFLALAFLFKYLQTNEKKEKLTSFLQLHLKVTVSQFKDKLRVDSEKVSAHELQHIVTKFVYHQNLNSTHWVSIEGSTVKINRFKGVDNKKEKHKKEPPHQTAAQSWGL